MSKYKSSSKRTCIVFVGKDRRHYFHVKRRNNGEVIAQSEGYQRRIDCINTAKLVTGGRLKIEVVK